MTVEPTSSTTATAPCRADLAGGTLDIWPLGLLHPGSMTVNAAIPVWVALEIDLEGARGQVLHSLGDSDPRILYADDAAADLTAAISYFFRPGGGVRIRVKSQAPVGSGLGGSSAYAVALSSALLSAVGVHLADDRLVALLRDLEARVLRAPTGVQDHWASITGGVSAIHLDPGGARVERLEVDSSWVGERLSVFNTGISHHSGMVNWQVIRRRLEGEAATTDALEAISRAAADCRSALLAADTDGVGRSIAREWAHRKRLAPDVCPEALEEIERAAMAAGALAFKACGAGGGGSVIVWHAPGVRADIEAALAAAAPAGMVMATRITHEGRRVGR